MIRYPSAALFWRRDKFPWPLVRHPRSVDSTIMGTFTELKIPLSPSQIEPVQRWLATFARHEEHWAQYPFLNDGHLHISAMCFPFFLGYVNRQDSNEFDVYRLKDQGVRAIDSQIKKRGSVSAGRYFRKALENLEFITVGEFLNGVEALPSPF